jgi:magnesium chelatase family protein
VLRYQSRISGPLLDRIDMQIEVAAMAPEALSATAGERTSAEIAKRVAQAFHRQLKRQDKVNQRLSGQEIDQYCRPDKAGEQLLRAAMLRLHWSARAYHRILKVARTIADLAAEPSIAAHHIAEAIVRSGCKLTQCSD